MLAYFAFLKGLKMDTAQWEQMESLIEKLGMKEAIDREIRRYSRCLLYTSTSQEWQDLTAYLTGTPEVPDDSEQAKNCLLDLLGE